MSRERVANVLVVSYEKKYSQIGRLQSMLCTITSE